MEYDWRLAEEVIDEATKRWAGSGDFPFEEVMQERWPSGRGGVGHAHARTRAIVRRTIREYYRPRDWSPEPTSTGR